MKACGWSCAGSTPAAAPVEQFEVAGGQALGTVAPQGGAHRLDVQLTHLATGDTPAFAPPGLGDGLAGGLSRPHRTDPRPRGVEPGPRRPRTRTSCSAGTARSPPSRSTTSTRLPRSSGAGGSTSSTRGAAAISTCSTTSPILGHGHPRLSCSRAPAVAAPQHQLPLPLLRGRRALRAAELAAARRARHRLPGQQRLRGRRPGAAAGLGAHGPPGRRRGGARRTTAGPTPPTPSPPRSPTTPTPWHSRPDWVHTVPAPNSYRGEHRGPDAHRYGPEAAAVIADLAGPAVHLRRSCAEPFYGNAGGMALPDGYLDRGLRRHPRRRRPLHRRRGPGRLRPAGHALLGLRAAGRRPRHRHRGQGDGQRPPPGGRHHQAGDRRRVTARRATSSPRQAAARSARRRD